MTLRQNDVGQFRRTECRRIEERAGGLVSGEQRFDLAPHGGIVLRVLVEECCAFVLRAFQRTLEQAEQHVPLGAHREAAFVPARVAFASTSPLRTVLRDRKSSSGALIKRNRRPSGDTSYVGPLDASGIVVTGVTTRRGLSNLRSSGVRPRKTGTDITVPSSVR